MLSLSKHEDALKNDPVLTLRHAQGEEIWFGAGDLELVLAERTEGAEPYPLQRY